MAKTLAEIVVLQEGFRDDIDRKTILWRKNVTLAIFCPWVHNTFYKVCH